MLVQNWIQKFNPRHINDCFDGSPKMNSIPAEIKNLQLEIQQDLKHFDKLSMSPN